MSTTPIFGPLLVAVAIGAAPARPVRRIGAAPRRAVHPAIVPALVFLTAFAVVAAERLALVISAGVAAATALRALSSYRSGKAATRRREIVASFLGHVVTNLRAGSGLAESCERAAQYLPEDCPGAVAAEIRQLAGAARSGATPNAKTPELAKVTALWALAVTRGLPLADLLGRARDSLDAAQRHRAATEAALAGPKTTAVVLTLLPLAGVAMGSAMGANPLGLLLGPGVGGWLLVAGTALVSAGFLTCQHIITRAAA